MTASTAQDESHAFVDAVVRLQRGPEPTALIYSTDLPLLHVRPDTVEDEDDAVRFARRVATVMARLSVLAQPATQQTMTPRAMLQELTDVVRHGLLLALPPDLRHGDAASVTAAFHACVSARQVPTSSIVDGLCTLAYTSAKLRVELVIAQLRRRLQHALTSPPKDESALAALLVTQTLLEDFAGIYRNVLLVVPLCHRLARPPQCATDALAGLQPAMLRYYYQLGDWVLRVGDAAVAPAVSLTTISRVHCDESRGIVTVHLHRPSCDVAWGLLFSEQGTLVDVDGAMRVHGRAQELHDLLCCTAQGAQVVAVNGTMVSGRGTSDDYGARARRVLHTIATATATRKTLQLTLSSPAFRGSVRRQPQEMAFVLLPQGGEDSAGQRASLLLHRTVPSQPWPFVLQDESLHWGMGTMRGLSPAARDFVHRHAHRLRLYAVNGVEVRTAAHAHALAESVETVLLELVVTADDTTRGPHQTRRSAAAQIKSRAALSTVSDNHPILFARSQPHEKDADAVVAQDHTSLTAEQPTTTTPQTELTEGVDARAATTPDPPAVSTTKDKSKTPRSAVVKRTRRAVRELQRRPATAVAATPSTTDEAAPVTVDTNATDKATDQSAPREVAVRSPTRTSRTTPKASPSKAVAPAAPKPCILRNHVQICALDEQTMVLERPDTQKPWGISIEYRDAAADTPQEAPLRLLQLPAAARRMTNHPFLRLFDKSPPTWYIHQVNDMRTTDPAAMLRYMLTLKRMTLHFLRK